MLHQRFHGSDRRLLGMARLFFLSLIAMVASQSAAKAQLMGREAADRRMVFYMSGDGSLGFVLDRTGPQTVMRLDGSRETIVLRPSLAARGDMLLQNEKGDVVLRLTSFGPATYYPQGNRRGIPVLRSRTDEKPDVPAADLDTLKVDAARLAAEVSVALGNSVVFDADWEALPQFGTAPLDEAVGNAAKALDNLSKEPEYAARLADGLNRVRFSRKARAGLRREGGTLYVDFADRPGLEGRPSSASIMSFLRETL